MISELRSFMCVSLWYRTTTLFYYFLSLSLPTLSFVFACFISCNAIWPKIKTTLATTTQYRYTFKWALLLIVHPLNIDEMQIFTESMRFGCIHEQRWICDMCDQRSWNGITRGGGRWEIPAEVKLRKWTKIVKKDTQTNSAIGIGVAQLNERFCFLFLQSLFIQIVRQ